MTHTHISLTEQFVARAVFVEALLDDLVRRHGVVDDRPILLRLAAYGSSQCLGRRAGPPLPELLPQLSVRCLLLIQHTLGLEKIIF